MLLSVIVPVYNEEKNLRELYWKLTKVLINYKIAYEILFVNDGSVDDSISIIKALAVESPHVRYMDFSRNFGHQIAVMAGLENCAGDAAVIIDADLQDPPELIIDLLRKYQEGFQVVYAKRKIRKGESFLKKATAKLFYRVLSSITSINIPLDTGDFRIIDRKIIDILKKMPEQHKYLRGQIAWVGFNQTYVEYERNPRFAGETGYTYKKMIKFAMDGITAFSDFPLKMATISGFVVSFISLLLIIYTLYIRLITGDYVAGWPSTMISVLFLGGIQLIGIGVIGEYIGRIGANVRRRPLYIIRESNTRNDFPKQEKIQSTI